MSQSECMLCSFDCVPPKFLVLSYPIVSFGFNLLHVMFEPLLCRNGDVDMEGVGCFSTLHTCCSMFKKHDSLVGNSRHGGIT